jgi:hypothetical protein
MKKKIMYIDMDGVISNFAKAAEEGGWKHRPDLKVNYRNLAGNARCRQRHYED